MKYSKWLILMAVAIILLGCSSNDAPSIDFSEVEMIFWENQSWEAGGGKSRLSIWADGRSEIMVEPDATFQHRSEKVRLRDGWLRKKDKSGVCFVRKNVFPADVAKEKFTQALEAGIHLIKTFKPDYVDGSGTVVGLQINGKLKETVVPMFLDRQQGSSNHRRYIAVSKLLSDFDRHAYDIQD